MTVSLGSYLVMVPPLSPHPTYENLLGTALDMFWRGQRSLQTADGKSKGNYHSPAETTGLLSWDAPQEIASPPITQPHPGPWPPSYAAL